MYVGKYVRCMHACMYACVYVCGRHSLYDLSGLNVAIFARSIEIVLCYVATFAQ